MKANIILGFCLVLASFVEVYGDGDYEVRRGTYPYMAFIYYPDESVVDAAGVRFLRGAVLIRPEWLVTSAVGPSVSEGPFEFPHKTLLARLGANSIDSNFTLNEDEEEQEREVTQIIRPYNHSATQWWVTDISLMKTLLPFNTTASVGFAALSPAHNFTEKMCMILVFAKKEGSTIEDKTLMQYYVELLPPSIDNCGSHFQGNTMACGADREDNKIKMEPNFCQGNSGGPLICEGEVMGIQTYIDNDCKQPRLYQLLASWDDFISCGTQNRCHEDSCKYVCDVIDKDTKTVDPGITSTTGMTTEMQVAETVNTETVNAIEKEPVVEKESLEETVITGTAETSTDISVAIESSVVYVEQVTTTTSTQSTVSAESSSITYSPSEDPTSDDDRETNPWPLEKHPTTEEPATTERKATLEARHQPVNLPRSDGHINLPNLLIPSAGFYIMAFLL